jgi:1-phosphofructokinase
MKIATITLNPAIDQTVFVDDFAPNSVNRARAMQRDAGGKGVNVASFLADFGLPVTVTGLLGAENPHIFERHFAAKGINDRFIRVPGATRIGIKIVDEARQQTTDINLPGTPPPDGALQQLLQTIDALADDHDWFVLAGKLPPGVADGFAADLISRLRSRGRNVALDASGHALTLGLNAAPTLVKPNIDELRQIGLISDDSPAAVAAAARALCTRGIAIAIVSLGAAGAVFCDGRRTLLARPPRVTVRSTVGAGDAMVAGTIAGLSRGLNLAQTAQLASAFSLAALAGIGAHLLPLEQLDHLATQVTVTELSSAAALVDIRVQATS